MILFDMIDLGAPPLPSDTAKNSEGLPSIAPTLGLDVL
jgi:hypothetical protein